MTGSTWSGLDLWVEVSGGSVFLLAGLGSTSVMEVMTVVEGRVSRSRIGEFEEAYATIKEQAKPPGWKRSMLLRDTGEQGLYRISTLWESREALDKMRKNSRVPVALALFRDVGVEPNVRVFEIPVIVER